LLHTARILKTHGPQPPSLPIRRRAQNLPHLTSTLHNHPPKPLQNSKTLTPPPNLPTFTPADLDYLWPRFTTAVHDSLAQPASNTLPSFRTLCACLWPPFIAPILAGHYTPREFSKLMVRNRHLFQCEDALKISLIQPPTNTSSSSLPSAFQNKHPTTTKPSHASLTSPLPALPTTLLLTAYLTSHTLPKHDSLLFSKLSTKRKRRRTGTTSLAPRTPNKKTHIANTARKISRIQMLGAQAFPLERMLAIYSALFRDYDYDYDNNYRDGQDEDGEGRRGKKKRGTGNAGGEAEILMQFRTL
ncbi:MAG: hypothetical protein Q9180_009674, partial [Flavoplaca navasiana]